MSPVFFLFIIQDFLDSLKLNAQKVELSFFPENKNGNPQTCKVRLLNQNTSAKGKTFEFRNALFVDDSMFLFNSCDELQRAASEVQEYFAQFCLIVHVGNATTNQRPKRCTFPPLLQKQKN
jgi:hypothetical protein